MISVKSAKHIKSNSKSANPQYIERGYEDAVVLIPGWASDYRIFATLDLRFNYLIPRDCSPFSFEKSILAALKENSIKKISLFGWSLGGFVASEFASKYANLINEIILVSIRKRYKVEELIKIKEYLNKTKKGYIYKFYTQCFFEKNQMNWFRKRLLKLYCKELSLDNLLKGLKYLENAEIKPAMLNDIKKITIIHGEHDSIAPMGEAIDIKDKIPRAKFVCIKDAGHIPFLSDDFKRYL